MVALVFLSLKMLEGPVYVRKCNNYKNILDPEKEAQVYVKNQGHQWCWGSGKVEENRQDSAFY